MDSEQTQHDRLVAVLEELRERVQRIVEQARPDAGEAVASQAPDRSGR
jgi:hypothetical protein